jgi:hypothetical protein
LATSRQQLTKPEKKSPEELREFLAGRAQTLKDAAPKAAKGKMSGLDLPDQITFELEISLMKYPTLYSEYEAQETRWGELEEMDLAVKEQKVKDFMFKSEKKKPQEKAATKPPEKAAREQPEREKKRSDGDIMDRLFGKTTEEKLASFFASSLINPAGTTKDNGPNTRGGGRGQSGNSRGGQAPPGRGQGRGTGPNNSNAPGEGAHRGGPGSNSTSGRGYGRGGMQQQQQQQQQQRVFPPKPKDYPHEWSRWMNWGRESYCEHEGLPYEILDPREYGGDEEHNLGLCAMAWRGRPCRKERWMECPLRHWRLERTWKYWVDQTFYERSKTLGLQLNPPDHPLLVYRGVTRYKLDYTAFSGREQQHNILADSGPPKNNVWHDSKESLQQRIRDNDKAASEAAKARAVEAEAAMAKAAEAEAEEAEHAEQAANQLLAEQAAREAVSHDGEERES